MFWHMALFITSVVFYANNPSIYPVVASFVASTLCESPHYHLREHYGDHATIHIPTFCLLGLQESKMLH